MPTTTVILAPNAMGRDERGLRQELVALRTRYDRELADLRAAYDSRVQSIMARIAEIQSQELPQLVVVVEDDSEAEVHL